MKTAIVTGKSKWFNTVKGYGFVAVNALGIGDVLLHAKILRAQGLQAPDDGATVAVEVERHPSKGWRAKRVISIERRDAA